MTILIVGINGKMGKMLKNLLSRYLVIGIDTKESKDVFKSFEEAYSKYPNISLALDFSSTTAYQILVEIIKKKISLISGTTGYNNEMINKLNELALENDSYFNYSVNYSNGINDFIEIAEKYSSKYSNKELIETHSINKHDKPSGTAIHIAEKLGLSINDINSIRLSNANASHEIILSNENERLIIKHEVLNRLAYVEGIIYIVNELLKE